jgi:Fe-S cluster assembly iron-binding protein IscA
LGRRIGNMINATPIAAKKLQEQLVARCSRAGIGFRMLVNESASDKRAFSLKIDRQRQQDKVIETNGVWIFLDPTSVDLVSNSQLDYQENPEGSFILKAAQESINIGG